MKLRANLYSILTLAGLSTPIIAQGIQTPPSVVNEAAVIGERFSQILEEECPINICNSVGCEATRFLTLDEKQDSSLPGLSTSEAPTAKEVQYRLAAVKCEFAYEPTFDESKLAGLRQRILQKVRQGSVNLQLISRKLLPKEDIAPPAPKTPAEIKAKLSKEDLIVTEFAPFLPWISIITVVGLFALAILIIRYRHRLRNALSQIVSDTPEVSTGPVISAEQLLERTAYIRRIYHDDPALAELAIRPLLDQNNLDELCRILKHLGPELFSPFKQRGQFETVLDALAAKYQEYTSNESSQDFSAFLDRLDRRLTAAKVGMNTDPLSYEFAFMDRMQVDELVGLLRELTELEGLAIIVNGPQKLRQELFASAGPSFVAKFIKYLTGQERLSDQFVRLAVQKARRIYDEKAGALKVITVNKLPLLEDALNALDHSQRTAVISEMQKDQPQVLNSVSSRIFLDASLAKFNGDFLTEAFLLISPKAAAAYIDSLEGQIDVLPKLKPRLQEAIRPFLGATLLDRNLVKEARLAISQFVKDKDAQGVIDLGKINSSLFT